MWPISKSALFILATTVAALLSNAWTLPEGSTPRIIDRGRELLGWFLEPQGAGQVIAVILGVLVVTALVTRSSWIGSFGMVVVQLATVVLLMLMAVPGPAVVGVVLSLLVVAAWGFWILRTWIDWPWPTVPALYAVGALAVVAAALVLLGHPGLPGAAPGPLAGLLVPGVLAVGTVAVIVGRILVGSENEARLLEFAMGVLVPALVVAMVWHQGGVPQLGLFVLALLPIGAIVWVVNRAPRELYTWYHRSIENPPVPHWI